MRKRFGCAVLALVLAGCGGRTPPAGRPHARAAQATVLADSAPNTALPPVRLGGGRGESLVLLAVSPPRAEAAPPQADATPGAPAAPPESAAGSDRLPTDERLRPPVPRRGALPAVANGATGWVELDVRIDESGVVTDAVPAAGDTGAAIVREARAAARAMSFYPARLAGHAVAVWTRQRFEVRR